MKHVENLTKDSKDLDVIIRGTVTGKNFSSEEGVIYQIESICGDCFEANEKCVYTDVTKPVEVHQYVADWYERNKNNFDYNLWNYIIDWDYKKEDEFKKWLNNSNKAFQTLVNMHQFGYKIKKEKKYIVKFKNVMKDSSFLKYDSIVGKWYFGMKSDSIAVHLYHTKEELEAGGFGGVFDNPMFEVKEKNND